MLPLRVVVLVLAVALVAACSGTPAADHSPSADDRIRAIRGARQAIGGPAVTLGEASRSVVASLEAVRAEPPRDPVRRRAAVLTATSDPLDDLDDAIGRARAVELGEVTQGTAAARDALAEAVGAAEDLLAAAHEDVAIQLAVAEADATLQRLVATWDERGSRNEQLDRLSATERDAGSLVAELEGIDPLDPCPDEVERRRRAARFVAAATSELRGYVDSQAGNRFDERRDELRDDPYGLEEPLTSARPEELACWRDDAPVVLAAAEVDAALERVEAALNPADLASRPSREEATPTPGG